MSRDWTYLLWSEKTWGERAQTIVAFTVASIVSCGMFIGALLVLGAMMDGISRYNAEHDRCLKHATNGYEIEKCR